MAGIKWTSEAVFEALQEVGDRASPEAKEELPSSGILLGEVFETNYRRRY